jgi:Meiotically Up-regulated Gene 113 (MUG113) protein
VTERIAQIEREIVEASAMLRAGDMAALHRITELLNEREDHLPVWSDVRAARWFEEMQTVTDRNHTLRGVYAATDGRFLKIGKSVDIETCIHQQRRSNPTLRLIAVLSDTPAEETAFHRRFRHLRIEREWFRLNRELAELIYVAVHGDDDDEEEDILEDDESEEW